MKNTYIGIDLGTSAAKLLLVDEDGSILNSVTKEYPLEFPQPGWSQQDPEDWKWAVFSGIPELLRGFDAASVSGIGCGGQRRCWRSTGTAFLSRRRCSGTPPRRRSGHHSREWPGG